MTSLRCSFNERTEYAGPYLVRRYVRSDREQVQEEWDMVMLMGERSAINGQARKKTRAERQNATEWCLSFKSPRSQIMIPPRCVDRGGESMQSIQRAEVWQRQSVSIGRTDSRKCDMLLSFLMSAFGIQYPVLVKRCISLRGDTTSLQRSCVQERLRHHPNTHHMIGTNPNSSSNKLVSLW